MAQTAQFDIPWQKLIDNDPNGVCILDATGTVRYANAAALALLSLEAPNGAPAADWFADLGDLNRDLVLKTIKQYGEVRLHRPEAEIKYLVFAAEPLAEGSGILCRIHRDDEVEAAETMAILIHDLRLPLTSIMGYAKMLLTIDAESLSDMQSQFLNTIDRNVQRLEHNLSAVQDMTRIDRGKINLTLTCISPVDAGTQVLDELTGLVEEKGHDVTCDFPDDLPPVYADAERFRQTLRILLENAAKYTPPGGKIGLCGHETGDLVQIDLTDNGPGIPFAEQKKIFSKFFRGEDEKIREYHGLGLNLYIARGITLLQNGQLWFESTPGTGSKFSLTLPICKAA